MPTEPFDLGRVRTRPLEGRPSLVGLESFAKLPAPGAGAREILDSLPDILAGGALRELVEAVTRAHRDGRGILVRGRESDFGRASRPWISAPPPMPPPICISALSGREYPSWMNPLS